jgi:uncharacterized phage protein gp47/JayE
VFAGAGTIPEGSLIANDAGTVFAAVADIVAAGAGTEAGTFACVENGPTPMPGTGSLTIMTPVSNWSSVALHDGDNSVSVGRDIETLSAARRRRLSSLMATGSATIDAIRAAILDNVSTVSVCQVTENDTNATVGSQPPHSIHVVCQSDDQGDDEKQEIAVQIWAKRSAGITMQGDISEPVIDSQGKSHVVKFDYATELDVDLVVDWSYFPEDPTPPPDDVEAALTAAIGTIFSSLVMSEDVLAGKVIGGCYAVPGIKINGMSLNGSTGNTTVADSELAVVGTITYIET